jgi:hypothetical protein
VLRLAGLPAVSRFPRVLVRAAADGLALEFAGEDGTRTIDVPVRLLGAAAADLEAVQLDLLADLQRRGYAVTWVRP